MHITKIIGIRIVNSNRRHDNTYKECGQIESKLWPQC